MERNSSNKNKITYQKLSDVEEQPELLSNMPEGHENYDHKDIDKCPFLNSQIANSAQQFRGLEPELQDDDSQKSLSSSGDEEEDDEDVDMKMPEGHEGYSDADKDKCPVMSGKIPIPDSYKKDGQPEKRKKKKKTPQGSCPFMPSESKRAPPIEHYKTNYEIPYVSTLSHMFSFKGITNKEKRQSQNRSKLDSYPIFLKHTLFHDLNRFRKIRQTDISARFFTYDKYKEQGNRKFNKRKYNDAICLYEHALSCVRWLEFREGGPKKEEDGSSDSDNEDNHSQDEEVKREVYDEDGDEKRTNSSDQNIVNRNNRNKKKSKKQIKQEKQFNERLADPMKGMSFSNKAFITVLNDDNVHLHQDDNLEDAQEKDMRDAMLMNIYLSLASCYMKMYHFKEAIQACDEAIKLSKTSSQPFLKRSQARACNKGASVHDLRLAEQDAKKAIELMKDEKIFDQEEKVLRLLNIHNAKLVYPEHLQLVEDHLKDRWNQEKYVIRNLFSKVKEIEFIEDAVREENKQTEDQDEEHAVRIGNDEELMEYEMMKEIIGKYKRVLEFHFENEKKDQIKLAKSELQSAMATYSQMKLYYDLDFENPQDNEVMQECLQEFKSVNLKRAKTVRRLDNLKKEKAKDTFENAHFNMEIYQYAYKEYLQRKFNNKNKKKKDPRPQFQEPKKSLFDRLINLRNGAECSIQIAIVIGVFLAFWYLNKINFFDRFKA